MRSALLPITLLGLAVAGCTRESASPSQAPQPPQTHLTYIAEWVGEDAVIGRNPVSLTLADDRAYGNAGCNHWFANYQLEGESIRFTDIGSTRKLCLDEIMQQERHFLDLLGKVERWDISNIDQLRFWPAEGKPLRFWPAQE
ncbi:META domain-containing protein [Pseudomonas sp. ABC1]|uniref:META domain-containing protein n=1 Tax=Pseudomonas sp. ABC1 TaxID=2748080 RepID=UPI002119DA93|nr:META domain-containing protein [Pseudomonas sp. ABC1]